VRWQITAGPIDHSEPGVDGLGWLWEIARDDEYRRVFVEVSGTAFASRLGIANDTVDAIATKGGSVVDTLLRLEDPPRIVKCSTAGCRHVPN
jgi:hypothetical protein